MTSSSPRALLQAAPLLLPLLGGCTASSTPGPADPGPAAPSAPVLEPARAGLGDLLAGLGITWLPDERRLEVAGWVNQVEGPIELFACAPGGKTHESVLVLDCVPRGLQAGLLALGLEPGTPFSVDEDGTAHSPTGDLVEVLVRWTDATGTAREAHAEDWVLRAGAGEPMARGGWVFAGSQEVAMPDGNGAPSFAADEGRTLIATYHDSSSILETPDEAAGDDDAFLVNPEVVPAVGTEVAVILRAAAEGGAR